MSTADAEARLKFLKTVADQYAQCDPSTSAYLMSQHALAIQKKERAANKYSADTVCRGCSTTLIHGWTSRAAIINKDRPFEHQTTKQKKSSRRKITHPQEKFVKTECLRCHRFEERPLSQLPRGRSNPPKISNSSSNAQQTPSAAPAQQDLSKPTDRNASSKLRAKARKQGGLHAMLEKSKAAASSSSGFGLDLLDLMKQD